MLCGIGRTFDGVSFTFTDNTHTDGIPEELIRIGETMATEDYIKFGPRPRGYDHVVISVL